MENGKRWKMDKLNIGIKWFKGEKWMIWIDGEWKYDGLSGENDRMEKWKN